jgi:hypothetical protein
MSKKPQLRGPAPALHNSSQALRPEKLSPRPSPAQAFTARLPGLDGFGPGPAHHYLGGGGREGWMGGVGMRTVTVQYGPDGSVVWLPYPCRWQLNLNHKTDGRRDGQHPSNTVPICPSTALDGFGRESLNEQILKSTMSAGSAQIVCSPTAAATAAMTAPSDVPPELPCHDGSLATTTPLQRRRGLGR